MMVANKAFQVYTTCVTYNAGEAGAAALAIINSTANLGGVMGPILLGHFADTVQGLSALAALLLVSAGMVAAYPSSAAKTKGITRLEDVEEEEEEEETLMSIGAERSS